MNDPSLILQAILQNSHQDCEKRACIHGGPSENLLFDLLLLRLLLGFGRKHFLASRFVRLLTQESLTHYLVVRIRIHQRRDSCPRQFRFPQALDSSHIDGAELDAWRPAQARGVLSPHVSAHESLTHILEVPIRIHRFRDLLTRSTLFPQAFDLSDFLGSDLEGWRPAVALAAIVYLVAQGSPADAPPLLIRVFQPRDLFPRRLRLQ